MPQEVTQDTSADTGAGTEAEGLTERGAVDQLLSKWGKEDKGEQQEAPAEEAEVEQPEGDVQAEVETTDDAPDAEEGDVEIDVAGEKFKLPAKLTDTVKRIEAKAKEVEAGATRKFQEAADLRKAVELQAQSVTQLQQIAEANADLIGEHKMIARRLETLEKINHNAIDSETLSKLNFEYNQLVSAKQRIEAQYGQNVQQMQTEHSKAMQAKAEHSEKLLSQHIKGWGQESKRKLAEYAMSKGAPAEALSGITDPWMVMVLDDAMHGHAMRQAKPEVKRVVQQAKTLAPTSAGPKTTTAQVQSKIAMSRLQKTGSVQDAAMALLARAQTRKR